MSDLWLWFPEMSDTGPAGTFFAAALLNVLTVSAEGQKMVEWNELDVASFLEQATGFLAEHGQLDGPSCHAPPAKRARSVGVIAPSTSPSHPVGWATPEAGPRTCSANALCPLCCFRKV